MEMKMNLTTQKMTYIKATQNPDDFSTAVKLHKESFVEVLPHVSSCSWIGEKNEEEWRIVNRSPSSAPAELAALYGRKLC